jgi:hypothetical protein
VVALDARDFTDRDRGSFAVDVRAARPVRDWQLGQALAA